MRDYLTERDYRERLERDKRAREERRQAIMRPVKEAIEKLGDGGQNMLLGMAWQGLRAVGLLDKYIENINREREQAIAEGQIHALEDLLGVERDRLAWSRVGENLFGDSARMAIWDSEACGYVWEDSTTFGTYKRLIEQEKEEV